MSHSSNLLHSILIWHYILVVSLHRCGFYQEHQCLLGKTGAEYPCRLVKDDEALCYKSWLGDCVSTLHFPPLLTLYFVPKTAKGGDVFTFVIPPLTKYWEEINLNVACHTEDATSDADSGMACFLLHIVLRQERWKLYLTLSTHTHTHTFHWGACSSVLNTKYMYYTQTSECWYFCNPIVFCGWWSLGSTFSLAWHSGKQNHISVSLSILRSPKRALQWLPNLHLKVLFNWVS